MSDRAKIELRKWITEANVAIHRGDAHGAYEALKHASFLAGTEKLRVMMEAPE